MSAEPAVQVAYILVFYFFFFVTSLLFSCFLLLKDIDPYRALGQRRMIFSSIIELDSGIAKKKKNKNKELNQ